MNCSFNIRYKPRTTREFTKSDLTVYDSAGNTALNALTVYGKSEVVNNEIVSAGEGWATVDLGTLTWHYLLNATFFYANGSSLGIKTVPKASTFNGICANYVAISYNANAGKDKCIFIDGTDICIRDTKYTDETAFKNFLSGVMLCCELADPTQGNAIAVKTDNGTGIDGTMATFTTGTPLYGVSDTVRDVMTWDGSAGTVTKNCAEVDLGTKNWNYVSFGGVYVFTCTITDMHNTALNADNKILCSRYPQTPTATSSNDTTVALMQDKEIQIKYESNQIYVRDSNYTDATAFKSAMSGVKLVYELATPTIEQLTSTENASISALRTFEPTTRAQNNAQTDMTVDYTIRVPTI